MYPEVQNSDGSFFVFFRVKAVFGIATNNASFLRLIAHERPDIIYLEIYDVFIRIILW
jgi:hypothetical protein